MSGNRKNLESEPKRKVNDYKDATGKRLLTTREVAKFFKCRIDHAPIHLLRYNMVPVVEGKITLWREQDVNFAYSHTWENTHRKAEEIRSSSLEEENKRLKDELRALKRRVKK